MNDSDEKIAFWKSGRLWLGLLILAVVGGVVLVVVSEGVKAERARAEVVPTSALPEPYVCLVEAHTEGLGVDMGYWDQIGAQFFTTENGVMWEINGHPAGTITTSELMSGAAGCAMDTVAVK